MATFSEEAVTPSCFLAHHVLNKLTAILSQCDLLQPETATPAASERVDSIRDLTRQIAQNVVHHQCALDQLLRNQVERKP